MFTAPDSSPPGLLPHFLQVHTDFFHWHKRRFCCSKLANGVSTLFLACLKTKVATKLTEYNAALISTISCKDIGITLYMNSLIKE